MSGRTDLFPLAHLALRLLRYALVAVSLAALFVTPWSYLKCNYLLLSHFDPGSKREDGYCVLTAWGRVFVFNTVAYPDAATSGAEGHWSADYKSLATPDSYFRLLANYAPYHGFPGAGVTYNTTPTPTGSYANTAAPPTTPQRVLILSMHGGYLLLLAAPYPAWFYVRLHRSRRRLAPHLCPGCHYDLRSTPDAEGPLLAVCPECGRARG